MTIRADVAQEEGEDDDAKDAAAESTSIKSMPLVPVYVLRAGALMGSGEDCVEKLVRAPTEATMHRKAGLKTPSGGFARQQCLGLPAGWHLYARPFPEDCTLADVAGPAVLVFLGDAASAAATANTVLAPRSASVAALFAPPPPPPPPPSSDDASAPELEKEAPEESGVPPERGGQSEEDREEEGTKKRKTARKEKAAKTKKPKKTAVEDCSAPPPPKKKLGRPAKIGGPAPKKKPAKKPTKKSLLRAIGEAELAGDSETVERLTALLPPAAAPKKKKKEPAAPKKKKPPAVKRVTRKQAAAAAANQVPPVTKENYHELQVEAYSDDEFSDSLA